MRRLVLVLALVATFATPAFAGPIQSPILGGTPAQDGQFPNVVAIEVGGGLCSGTLIAPDWVLTAAHCVNTDVLQLPSQQAVTASVKVHFHTVDLSRDLGTVVTAQDTIPDPMFSINSLGSHDSGLIHLSHPVTDITPTPINLDPMRAPVGVGVTMVGFGATATDGGGMVGVEYVVQQTSMTCTAQEGSDANLLCFDQSGGKGKCEGDSGGPSFAMIDGEQVEVGITSFGDQSCASFGADTRVDAEASFITAHVPRLYCAADADCEDSRTCFEHTCIVQPFSPGGLGATCTSGSDCDSGQCAAGDGAMKCSMGCTPGQADSCPSGLSCLDTGGGAGACWPADEGGGCCDASGRGGPTALFGLALVALVVSRRRR